MKATATTHAEMRTDALAQVLDLVRAGLPVPLAVRMQHDGRPWPSDILHIQCDTEADARAWCEYFGDPGERNRAGYWSRSNISWRGWSVQLVAYTYEAS